MCTCMCQFIFNQYVCTHIHTSICIRIINSIITENVVIFCWVRVRRVHTPSDKLGVHQTDLVGNGKHTHLPERPGHSETYAVSTRAVSCAHYLHRAFYFHVPICAATSSDSDFTGSTPIICTVPVVCAGPWGFFSFDRFYPTSQNLKFLIKIDSPSQP